MYLYVIKIRNREMRKTIEITSENTFIERRRRFMLDIT